MAQVAERVAPQLPPVEMVPLRYLRVDSRYQQDLNQARVAEMAGDFRPELCGPLLVSKNGRDYFVYDGQHRLACLRLLGFTEAACMVSRLTEAEQAISFVDAQRLRRNVSPLSQHRALVMAGDQGAREIEQALASLGLRFSVDRELTSLTAVRAVERVRKHGLIMGHGHMWVAQVLGTLKDAWGHTHAGFAGKLIVGMSHFMLSYLPETDELVEKLRREEPRHVLARINAASGGGDTQKLAALEILEVWNHGRRSRRGDPSAIYETMGKLKGRKSKTPK